MGSGGTRTGRGGQLVLAAGVWLAVFSATADAQFFGSSQSSDSFTLRPPRDVPSVAPGPTQSSIPPSGNVAPKGPLLQSPAAAHPPAQAHVAPNAPAAPAVPPGQGALDRKSTRLNSSHSQISYAVFCLKKKKKK